MGRIKRIPATVAVSNQSEPELPWFRACLFVGTSPKVHTNRMDDNSGCGEGRTPRAAIRKALVNAGRTIGKRHGVFG